MKYYETPKKKKHGDSVLYILISFGLIAVGALTWFALSRSSDKMLSQSSVPQLPSDSSMPYPEINSSHGGNISGPSGSKAENVNNSAESIPYSSAQSEAAEPVKPEQAPIMPADGKILKKFSSDILQYSSTFGDMRLHLGTDIEAAPGTAVKAVADGVVTAADESPSLGNTVTVEHSKGLTVRYCGLSNVIVTVGKKVKMGDSIAAAGTVPCECADKNHIHIEAFKNGKAVSLLDFIGKLPE